MSTPKIYPDLVRRLLDDAEDLSNHGAWERLHDNVRPIMEQLLTELEAKTAKIEEMLAHEVDFQGESFRLTQKLKEQVEAWREAAEIAEGRVPCTCWPRCLGDCPKNKLLPALEKARALDAKKGGS